MDGIQVYSAEAGCSGNSYNLVNSIINTSASLMQWVMSQCSRKYVHNNVKIILYFTLYIYTHALM